MRQYSLLLPRDPLYGVEHRVIPCDRGGPCPDGYPDLPWNDQRNLRRSPGKSIDASTQRIKRQLRAIVGLYTKSNNARGLIQIFSTLVPLALLWWAAALGAGISYWLTAAAMLLISLFTLRVFALMHECGHDSLFRSHWLNSTVGFLLGVLSGMPQYVWSQHHSYHHAHNGNWEKYRGPYTTLSVDEYAALNGTQQRMYRGKCSMGAAPIAGFIYLIANPRLNWLKGSIGFACHVLKGKLAQPHLSFKAHAASFQTSYWKSAREYRHMSGNNLVLLCAWGAMCWVFGAGLFSAVYILSLSLAGGAGIILFTVQHNFEHSYASDTKHWSYTTGAMRGTSYLVLPRWLNWFTANIGYHHIHHLSSHIPNYCLVRCHNEQQQFFTDVTRLKLSQVHASLKCILWDTRAQQIISVAEYRQQLVHAHPA
jgi:acyl-lipid omega-6 desaturase (Delta-12 desaturase)